MYGSNSCGCCITMTGFIKFAAEKKYDLSNLLSRKCSLKPYRVSIEPDENDLPGDVVFSLLGTVEFLETSSELESLEELEVVDVFLR